MRLLLVLLAISSCFSAVGSLEIAAKQTHGWSLERFVRASAANAVRTGHVLTILDMMSECQQDGFFRTRPFTNEEKAIFIIKYAAAITLVFVNSITFKARLAHVLHLDENHRWGIIHLGTDREVIWDFLWNGMYACMISVMNARNLYTCLSDNYVVLDRSHRGESCPVCWQYPENAFIAPCGLSSHFLCVSCYRDLLADGEYTCFLCEQVVPEQRVVASPPSFCGRLSRLTNINKILVLYTLCLELIVLWCLWIDIDHYEHSIPRSVMEAHIGLM